MIHLERHIEMLLLSSDCVVVPGLGGFVAHHLAARYDAEEGRLIPPQRTLGFSPRLSLNDNLLAQSYAEAYDLSYPEALKRIEEEVGELRQHLRDHGQYELADIGVLHQMGDGRFDFQPCEAGILTPALYGLSEVVMARMEQTHEEKNTASEPSGSGTISVSISVLRNAAAIAAAIVAFFLITTPMSTEKKGLVAASHENASILMMHKPEGKSLGSASFEMPKTAETKTAKTTSDVSPKASAEETWTLVLAAGVGREGADRYVEDLATRGLTDGAVWEQQGSSRKVVYGRFASEEAARQQLGHLRGLHSDFREAWVMNMKTSTK